MKQAPDPTLTSQRETLPMQVDVKIHSLHASGPVLADASVNLNGCFAIRGVKVVEGSNGPFVSMPSYKGRDGYKDICFPCTKEFRQQFHQAVLDAYQLSAPTPTRRSDWGTSSAVCRILTCPPPNGASRSTLRDCATRSTVTMTVTRSRYLL